MCYLSDWISGSRFRRLSPDARNSIPCSVLEPTGVVLPWVCPVARTLPGFTLLELLNVIIMEESQSIRPVHAFSAVSSTIRYHHLRPVVTAPALNFESRQEFVFHFLHLSTIQHRPEVSNPGLLSPSRLSANCVDEERDIPIAYRVIPDPKSLFSKMLLRALRCQRNL